MQADEKSGQWRLPYSRGVVFYLYFHSFSDILTSSLWIKRFLSVNNINGIHNAINTHSGTLNMQNNP